MDIKTHEEKDIFWRDFVNLEHSPYRSDKDMSSFRALFIYVVKDSDLSKNDYPIAFGYLASLLRMNRAAARIVIQDPKEFDPEKYEGHDLICFYPMTALFFETIKLAERVKDKFPGTKISFLNSEQHQHEMLLCAPKAAEFGRRLMEENPFIDYVLIGEAEDSFIRLCENLAAGDDGFADIPACFYRYGDEIRLSKKRIAPVNFEFLPYASRDFLERGVVDGINSHAARVQSSRGCLSPCLYCAESSANITKDGRRKAWVGRDIIKFVDEIELLAERYKIVFFNIMDSSFEDPGSDGIMRMRTFCEEIAKRNIGASFKIHLRAETIDKLSDDFLHLMKDTGLDILIIGLESGLDRELRAYKKITKAEESLRVIDRLDKTGLFFPLLGYMMFGPSLRLEDLPKKVEYIASIHRDWDNINMTSNVLIYYGTAYHDYVRRKGLIASEDRLSPTVTYKYEDKRVELIAQSMNNLKNECPAVVKLQRLLYDALNIRARYRNRMNKNLWKEGDAHFQQFNNELNRTLLRTGDVYRGYFFDLIELAKSGWSPEARNSIYHKWVPRFFPPEAERIERTIDDLINYYEGIGLSTRRLYLKTWLSLVNTQTETSKGVVKVA